MPYTGCDSMNSLSIKRNANDAAKSSTRIADRRKLAAERAAAVLAADGFLRLPEVLSLIPVSASTWWQGVRDLRFPAGVKLGARATAWRSADIRALLARLGKGEPTP
jgi:prophage regulatory protein